jgi:hypothetical protein
VLLLARLPANFQVFVGSALSGANDGVAAIKAWAVSKLPEGPTLYPKVSWKCPVKCRT